MHTVDSLVNPSPTGSFIGCPLSVVFADSTDIEAVRANGRGPIPLDPPFHMADEDTYFVLPDDIGAEVVDILKEGDEELLHEVMRDGLLAVGTMERLGRGMMALEVDEAATPAHLTAGDAPYASRMALKPGEVSVPLINALDHVRCTVMSALFDEEGLDRVLRRKEYVGPSWVVPPELRARLEGVDPTLVWSRRRQEGEVGIELALFQEYEELWALVRPLLLTRGP